MLHIIKIKYIPATNTKPRRLAITTQKYGRVVYNLDGMHHPVEEAVERYTTGIMKSKFITIYRNNPFEDKDNTYFVLETR